MVFVVNLLGLFKDVSMLYRKHFKQLAQSISFAKQLIDNGHSAKHIVNQIEADLVSLCQEYPKFDRDKFLKACGG